jgi:hypothetical protein
MLFCLLFQESPGIARQMSCSNLYRVNRDRSRMFTISCVKMRWVMLVIIDENDNPIKPAYFWHKLALSPRFDCFGNKKHILATTKGWGRRLFGANAYQTTCPGLIFGWGRLHRQNRSGLFVCTPDEFPSTGSDLEERSHPQPRRATRYCRSDYSGCSCCGWRTARWSHCCSTIRRAAAGIRLKTVPADFYRTF